MNRKYPWADRVLRYLEFGDETLPLLPILELCGEHRVLIENHQGVLQYGQEQICIRVRYGCLEICGCDLKLRRMQGQSLLITGNIFEIKIKRGQES